MRKQRLLNDIQKYWHLTYQSLQALGTQYSSVCAWWQGRHGLTLSKHE